MSNLSEWHKFRKQYLKDQGYIKNSKPGIYAKLIQNASKAYQKSKKNMRGGGDGDEAARKQYSQLFGQQPPDTDDDIPIDKAAQEQYSQLFGQPPPDTDDTAQLQQIADELGITLQQLLTQSKQLKQI